MENKSVVKHLKTKVCLLKFPNLLQNQFIQSVRVIYFGDFVFRDSPNTKQCTAFRLKRKDTCVFNIHNKTNPENVAFIFIQTTLAAMLCNCRSFLFLVTFILPGKLIDNKFSFSTVTCFVDIVALAAGLLLFQKENICISFSFRIV